MLLRLDYTVRELRLELCLIDLQRLAVLAVQFCETLKIPDLIWQAWMMTSHVA